MLPPKSHQSASPSAAPQEFLEEHGATPEGTFQEAFEAMKRKQDAAGSFSDGLTPAGA